MGRWLRYFLLGCGALLVARAGEWRASKPEVRAAVVATIEGQLAAFRAGDIAQAYDLAAAPLRAQRTRREFAAIVKQGYPEIWFNLTAEFGIVRDDGERATVTVQVRGREGAAPYDFTLLREADGWRILGVLRPAPKKSEKA